VTQNPKMFEICSVLQGKGLRRSGGPVTQNSKMFVCGIRLARLWGLGGGAGEAVGFVLYFWYLGARLAPIGWDSWKICTNEANVRVGGQTVRFQCQFTVEAQGF
jgi:hypothetical protein